MKRILSLFATTAFFFLLGNFIVFSYSPKIKLGIDVLAEHNFEIIKGKNIAVFTNYTARSNSGKLTLEILANLKNTKVICAFAPEHGFWATTPAGNLVSDEKIYNIPIYSLYAGNRKPTPKQLEKCDAIIVDIQDIGIRAYTYISTMFYIMQSAAECNKEVIVLDRPNPLGGLIVDGNTVDEGMESFVSIVPVSYIHGCTIGELAQMINEEGWLSNNKSLKCNLTVVKMEGWTRNMAWEDTGLPWLPTSPNIPTIEALKGSAMLGVIGELGIIGIGIGTTLPFQYIGGVYLNSEKILSELNKKLFPGVLFFQAKYRQFLKNLDKDNNAILIKFYSDPNFEPYTLGIKILLTIRAIHPTYFQKTKISDKSYEMFVKVTGTYDIIEAILGFEKDENILQLAKKGKEKYLSIRQKYLLYD